MFYVIGNETGVREYAEPTLQVMTINGSAQGYKTRAQREIMKHMATSGNVSDPANEM